LQFPHIDTTNLDKIHAKSSNNYRTKFNSKELHFPLATLHSLKKVC
jgi:hypothetical protein